MTKGRVSSQPLGLALPYLACLAFCLTLWCYSLFFCPPIPTLLNLDLSTTPIFRRPTRLTSSQHDTSLFFVGRLRPDSASLSLALLSPLLLDTLTSTLHTVQSCDVCLLLPSPGHILLLAPPHNLANPPLVNRLPISRALLVCPTTHTLTLTSRHSESLHMVIITIAIHPSTPSIQNYRHIVSSKRQSLIFESFIVAYLVVGIFKFRAFCDSIPVSSRLSLVGAFCHA